jgi:hypothetical protein
LLLAACASNQEVSRTGAGNEHVVSCGYFNWIYCYERAGQLCPEGYKTLSETEGGLRSREMRIACARPS